jgi:PAS domain S-box-containing protein
LEKNIDYRGVFNLIHEAIFIHEYETGKIIDVNDTCCNMFNCHRDEIINGDPGTFCSNVHPFTPEVNAEWIDRSRKRGPQVFEWHARTADDRLFWVEVTMKPVDLLTGRVIIAVVRDIENRKKLISQLSDNENRYRTLVETSPFGYVIHQEEKIVFVNKAGISMVGASSISEIVGKNVFEFIHPDYHAIARQRVKDLLATGKNSEPSEQVYLKVDGSSRHVIVTSVLIEYEGKPAVQAIIQDITERKIRERELISSQNRFQQIFTHSMDAICVVHDNSIVMVNNAYITMFGYEAADDLAGTPSDSFIAPQAREELKTRRDNRNSDGFTQNRYKTKGLKKDGEEFDLEVSVSFYEVDGEIFLVAILRDISVELQRQKKLADHVFYLNSMHRLSLVMEQYNSDTHIMIDKVLSEIINIFDADRAFLLFRFDDQLDRIHVPYSRSATDEFEIEGEEIPDDRLTVKLFNRTLDRQGFVELYRDSGDGQYNEYLDRLQIKAALFFLIDPSIEHKWVIGLHQCSTNRTWTDEEKELLQDISTRMAQVLRNLIMQDRVFHSEAQYRKLFETIQDVYIRTDRDSNIQLVSPSFEKLTLYSLEDAIQMNLQQDLFVYQEEYSAARDGVFEHGIIEGFISRIYRSDKSIAWISANFQVVRDADGVVSGLEGIIRDITREKEVEIALNKEKDRLSITLQSLGEGVITTNINGEITLSNQAAIEMTGVDENCIGKPFAGTVVCISASDNTTVLDPITDVLSSFENGPDSDDQVAFQDLTLVKLPGEVKTILLTASALVNSKNECTGVVVVLHDMTQRKKLESELQKRQKLESLGLIAGGIAHDFNNFLAGILGNIDLLRTISGLDKQSRDLLDEAAEATFRARDLTQQLLTFSKGGEPIKKSGDIGGLIRKTAMFPLRGSMIKTEMVIDDDLWPLEFDEGQLNQAFNNIIINAKQAMPDGGVISITLKNTTLEENNSKSLPAGRYVRIEFKDQGHGIPARDIEKIFDPFFTTKHLGSGLGLSTTYSIVKKHSGMIEIESEPGKGTSVIIYMPASTVMPIEQADHDTGLIKGKGIVLLMDDEEMILSVGSKILSFAGYTVETAHHGQEALEIFSRYLKSDSPVDVVILDITIPGGMGGAETLKRLKNLSPRVKAIVSSGYSNDPIMSDFRSYGFAGVVSKPYRMEDLLKTVNQIIKEENDNHPG